MKKQKYLLLSFIFALILLNPKNVFADAKCSANNIDATKWELTDKTDFTEDDFDLGYAKKVCCDKGSNYNGTFEVCDYYQLKEGVEPEINDSSDIDLDKIETNEENAVSCDTSVDLTNFVFDYTDPELDSKNDPSKQTDNRITCCKQIASSYATGVKPKWRCTYYVKKELIDQGYQTGADKAEEQEELSEREDLEDITGDTAANCNAIFDEEARELIERLFQIVCIAAPILLIVLGSVDFGNAVLSSDKEALQKAVKRFTTRCIVAVAIFFLPMLVDLIFHFPGMDIIEGIVFCDV